MVTDDDYQPRMMQDTGEIDALAQVFRNEKVRSYLEIGSRWGGSLWRLGSTLEVPSRIIAVDLPRGATAEHDSLSETARRLQAMGHVVRVIWGDSTEKIIVASVRAGGPYDAVFIDANHTLPYVRQDWQNYGPLGRVVAFHDISWRRPPDHRGTPIDVPAFWEEVKVGYRHREFRTHYTGRDNGIGVLWRA